ncbi:MAG TPA: vWA domain-containing protein [Myxococcales bacterium]
MIDASSSMRRTDPQKLRKVAAELYVDLARDGDSIAVAQFQAESKDVSGGFQTITGPAVRDRLKDAIRSIGDDGDWTDFGAAFEAAGKAFAAVPASPLSGEKRFLVFLTDGKCEPAPEEPRYLKPDEKPVKGKKAAEERESRCKSFVLSQALPAIPGVEAEVIGLSKSAPREFLEEVGRRTGGTAAVTEKAEDLPHLFAKIHAYNSGSRVAEADKDLSLPVDKLVASLDLVVVAPKDLELSIERPDGSALPADDRALYVVRSERYRFFHIPKPTPGAWRIKPSKRLLPAAIAAIQNYDLHLELKAEDHATVGSPLEIHVALMAGEGGGMPEAAFLARHQFSARAKIDGAFQDIELRDAPDGGKFAKFVPAKAGSLELSARVAPGPEGALTRTAGPKTVTVVPPLKLVSAPIALGELKPGARVDAKLDLSKSDFLGEVRLELATESTELAVKPRKLDLRIDQNHFDLTFEAPADAKPGPVSGALVLTPKSKPYVGREGGKVPVQAVILELTFWEKHGGKVVAGSLLFLLAFVVAGFKTPARFPKKLRVWYQDKPNGDDGDFGLWMRAKPGFYKPGTFRIGGGGPIRRSAPLLAEIVATKDGVRVRPAKGKALKCGGEELSREFRPEYKAKYEADEGLVFWIGKEEEEE